MRRLIVPILSATALLASLLSGVVATPALAASISTGCAYINQNGTHSLDLTDNFNAGEVITATQTGTDAMDITDDNSGALLAGSYSAFPGTSISYTIPSTGSWHFGMGLYKPTGENTIRITCSAGGGVGVSVPGCQSQFPVLSQVRVPYLVAAHWGAGKGEITRADHSVVNLPLDANHDGKDTYLVVAKQLVDGVWWVGLFLGSCNPAWLPLYQVQLLYPLG